MLSFRCARSGVVYRRRRATRKRRHTVAGIVKFFRYCCGNGIDVRAKRAQVRLVQTELVITHEDNAVVVTCKCGHALVRVRHP